MNAINFDKEIQQIDILLTALIEFHQIYTYQDRIKRVISEGVLYVIILSEIQAAYNSPMFESSLELNETKRTTVAAANKYIKDVMHFLAAHKSKGNKIA